MLPVSRTRFQDLDIKFRMGRYVVNILTINYEPPTPGWNYGRHNHSSCEFHFVPSGKGTLEANGRKYALTPGTLYLTGPGLYHKQQADLDDPMREYCLNLELSPSRKRAHADEYYLEQEVEAIAGLLQTPFLIGQDKNGAIAIFTELFEELQQPILGRFMLMQNLVGMILVKFLRSVVGNVEGDDPLPQKITDDRRRLIVDRFFNNRNNAPFTPEGLAGKIGVSVRQLNRIMLQYYGMTFKQRQTSIRIERAKDLLRNTPLPPGVIAERVGFSSQNYFCRIFKETVAMTPKAYREQPEK